jgi:hypothetical protein
MRLKEGGWRVFMYPKNPLRHHKRYAVFWNEEEFGNLAGRRHNIQYNGTQRNDTQHNDTQHNDTQHNDIWHDETQYNDTQHNYTQHNGPALLC